MHLILTAFLTQTNLTLSTCEYRRRDVVLVRTWAHLLAEYSYHDTRHSCNDRHIFKCRFYECYVRNGLVHLNQGITVETCSFYHSHKSCGRLWHVVALVSLDINMVAWSRGMPRQSSG